MRSTRPPTSYTAGPEPITVGETRAQATTALRDTVEGAGLSWSDQVVESVPKGLTIVSAAADARHAEEPGRLDLPDLPGPTGPDRSRHQLSVGIGQLRKRGHRPAGGDAVVYRQGRHRLHQRDAHAGRARTDPAVQPELRDRARRPADQQPDRRLHPVPDAASTPPTARQIQGNFSQSTASTLADQINSGALPIRLVPISESQVSATLGAQSLREGLIAGIIGPAARAHLPDRLLPPARRRGGARTDDLRGVVLRGRRPLADHADACRASPA